MAFEGAPVTLGLSNESQVRLPENIDTFEDDHPQDECGVYGIWAPGEPVMSTIYDALYRLRHRGQSGAGIAYYDTALGRLDTYTGSGKIYNAIPLAKPDEHGENLFELSGSDVALGHTRYSTATNNAAAQPFRYSWFTLAHNGHVQDADEVAFSYGVPLDAGLSDSDNIGRAIDKRAWELGSLEDAMLDVLPRLEGAYSLVLADNRQRLIGARDPWGFRPLALAALPDSKGYVLASEESAFKATGARFVRNLERGEIVVIDGDGIKSMKIPREASSWECMFEYIYLARPWETVNDVKVARARKNMGRFLAEDHPVQADIVVAVPNSGRSAAAGFAEASGLPSVEGIFVDEGAERTFILRQGQRDSVLAGKHHPNSDELEGKDIVLVDDSVIKGSTMRQLIKQLREEGKVGKVHVASAAPRYMHACYMGMDTRETWRLVARGRTDEEICREIGADSIIFNSVKRVHEAINDAREGSPKGMCAACTTGEYPFKEGTFANLGCAAVRSLAQA